MRMRVSVVTLLVACAPATKPRACPVDIQFAPHAKRISTAWRFDFSNPSTEMPTDSQTPNLPHQTTLETLENARKS
jgi:hypothetical protein